MTKNRTEGKRTIDFGALSMARQNIARVADSIQDPALRTRAGSLVKATEELDDDLRKHRGVKARLRK